MTQLAFMWRDVMRWLRTLSAPWFIRLEYERGEWQFNRPRDGQ